MAAAPHAVAAMIEQHRPWETLENMALIIIDQTYAAALDIAGTKVDGGVVSLSRPVDPAVPDSPLLTVHAGEQHCCIAFNNARGDAEAFLRYTSSKGKAKPTHRLARATVSIAPGMLHLARLDGVGRRDYWSCADVRPDVVAVSSRGELAILDAVVKRLDAAIRVEKTLLHKAAHASRCLAVPPCARVAEIDEVFRVLQKMRREMDLGAALRRRQQKRRCVEEVVTGTPAGAAADSTADQDHAEETEILTKRLKTLRVSSSSRAQAEVLICTGRKQSFF